jgi:eukaryotic-like serine/threonine-protein kinase
MKVPVLRCIGRYCIGPEIASGGMATVRLGQLEGPGGFRKLVAIKQLNAELAAEPGLSLMLAHEARLNSAISHPNVVSIFDVLEQDNELMLVMDYVNGETLAQLLRQTRKQGTEVPVHVARRMLNDVLHGLHAAHTATSVEGAPLGVVHRDVSPQNIMIGVDGIARVLDFGVAKAALGASYTAPGQVKGKLAYMAPEQVREQPVDARTDVFAAGVVLWEALSGRRLFVGGTASQVISRLLSQPVAPLSEQRTEVSLELDQLLQKALARAPAERFASARDFADALEASGKLASRAEVAAWVRSTAGAALEQRSRLCSELDAGTVRLQLPFPLPRASRALPVHRWLRAQRRRGGALLAAGATLLATAVVCLSFAPAQQATALSANTAANALVHAARPLYRQASPASAVLAAGPCATPTDAGSPKQARAALLSPPLRPESLRLETSPRGRPAKVATRGRKTPPARSAADVLGF